MSSKQARQMTKQTPRGEIFPERHYSEARAVKKYCIKITHPDQTGGRCSANTPEEAASLWELHKTILPKGSSMKKVVLMQDGIREKILATGESYEVQ